MRWFLALAVLAGCTPVNMLATRSQVVELREGQTAPRSGVLISWDLWNRMTNGLPAPDENGVISIEMNVTPLTEDHAIIQAWKELRDDRGDFCLDEVLDLSQALSGRNITAEYAVVVIKRFKGE